MSSLILFAGGSGSPSLKPEIALSRRLSWFSRHLGFTEKLNPIL